MVVQKRASSANKKVGLKSMAKLILKYNLKLKADESVVIISDDEHLPISQALYEKIGELCDVGIVQFKKNLSRIAVNAIKSADLLILIGDPSLESNPLLLSARKQGMRLVSLCGITEEEFKELNPKGYPEIASSTERLAKKVEGAKEIRITTTSGTNVRFSMEHIPVIRLDGISNSLRSFVRLPDGEVCLSPVEGGADGVIIVDGSVAGMYTCRTPIEIHLIKGRAYLHSDLPISKKISKLLDEAGPCAFVLGKFGIGMNSAIKIKGGVNDIKSLGSINFGLGENRIFGGKNACPIHLDFVVKKPTVTVDQKQVMVDGKLQFDQLYS